MKWFRKIFTRQTKTTTKTVCGYEVIVDPNWTSIASIYENSGDIVVSAEFIKIPEWGQELIITQLLLYKNNGHDIYKADADAIDKMMKKYPHIEKRFWYDILIKIIKSKPSDFNIKRIKELSNKPLSFYKTNS